MRILILSSAIAILGSQATASETWSCPDANTARSLFASGELQAIRNYSETDGARVQRQYPDTAFVAAHAKLIDWQGARPTAVCQYFNHVGLVSTFVVLDTRRADAADLCETIPCPESVYWRREYTASHAAEDMPGKEQILVCMEQRGDVEWPSTKCAFAGPVAGLTPTTTSASISAMDEWQSN